MSNIAILGAGNGGLTAAAHLTLTGHRVNLFEMPSLHANIAPVMEKGGIDIDGVEVEGFARLNKVTTDINEAIAGVDIILNMVPSFAYETFARVVGPAIEDRQVIVTMGKGGGSLHYARILRELGIKKDVILGECNTLPYGCRKTGPAKVHTVGIIREQVTGAFPGKNMPQVVAALEAIYPTRSIRPAANVLECILLDFNAITHVGPMICNAARIDSGFRKDEFHLFGRDENPPAVVNIIEAVDRERVAISKALGIEARTLEEEHIRNGYNPAGKEAEVLPMYESIHTEKLEAVAGPYSLSERHLTEDVPFGLVTWESLAKMGNVPTPVTTALITLASTLNRTDYRAAGRTVDKLGIDQGWSLKQLESFLGEGALS